ncbi:MAG TPA: SpoIIE family protein phosphatase, partial [Candidatus Aquilonibacter sp.]|nr:SpoIIE family protein phosphatase [Candidatus Aquilonibacter sp.]
MRLSLRTQALLLTAVPLLVLLLVFGLAVSRARQAQQMAYWGQHSQTVLEADAALAASISDLNLAIAANNLKQTPQTRLRFDGALAQMHQRAAALVTLVADNPEQIVRARHIVDLIDRITPVARQTFALARYPQKQRQIEQSKPAQQLAHDFERTRADFERAERRLAIDRFRDFSSEATGYIASFIAILVAGIILCAVIILVLGRRLSNRFLNLRRNVERLANDEDPIPLPGDDELSQLDRQFRETTMRMRREQAISSQLQRALLPQQLPTIAGIRIDASYRPAGNGPEIGGDWYDVFILGDHTIGISMGDVAGHGLLAASTMALVRQSIQTAARYTHDAASVLELVNRTIVDQGGAVVSAFFAIFDTHSGTMQYAVAGHPSPITVRSTGTIGMLAGS